MKKFFLVPLISGLVGFSVLFTMTIIYKTATGLLSNTDFSVISGQDAIDSLHGFWIAGLAGIIFSLFGGKENRSQDKEFSLYREGN